MLRILVGLEMSYDASTMKTQFMGTNVIRRSAIRVLAVDVNENWIGSAIRCALLMKIECRVMNREGLFSSSDNDFNASKKTTYRFQNLENSRVAHLEGCQSSDWSSIENSRREHCQSKYSKMQPIWLSPTSTLSYSHRFLHLSWHTHQNLMP